MFGKKGNVREHDSFFIFPGGNLIIVRRSWYIVIHSWGIRRNLRLRLVNFIYNVFASEVD